MNAYVSLQSLARGLFVVALMGAVGCSAAPAADETETSDDAISSSVAAAQLNMNERVLENAAATPGNALGVARWDVFAYADAKSGIKGAMAFASNADGNVRYAIALDAGDGTRGRAGVVRYDDDGVAKGSASIPMDAATANALKTELAQINERIQAEVRAQSKSTVRCALGLTGIVVAGAVAGAGIFTAGSGLVLAFGGGAGVTGVSGTLSGGFNFLGGALATALATPVGYFGVKAVTGLWDGTMAACGR